MKNNIHNKIHDYIKNGKYQLALNTVNKFLIREYDHDLLNYRAVIYILMNKFSAALTDLDKLNSFDPKNTITLCNLGLAYKGLDNKPKSKEFFKKSIQTDPSYVQAYLNLAELLIDSFEFKECIELLNKLNLIHTKIERSFQLLATCYREINQFKSHHEALQCCILINPSNFENYYHLGFSFIWLNNYEKALEAFEKSFRYNNHNYAALYQINKIKKNSIAYDFITSINHHHSTDLSDENQAYLELLKSDIHYQEKNYNDFFQCLHKANIFRKKTLTNKIVLPDISKIQSKYIEILDYDSTSYNTQFKPIFILGMPRTGSSVVEQVISNCNDVYGAGEIPIIHNTFYNFFNSNNKDVFENILNDINIKYSNLIKSMTNQKIIIDKLPLNFLWIGFIKKIFPNAKFIHTYRNKTDVCMSLYRNFFALGGLDFSYDMKSINDFYNLYLSHMNFWAKYNLDIFTFNYDNFIKNPSNISNSLFEYLGLNFSDRFLEIDKNTRPIKTASFIEGKNKIEKINYPDWVIYKNEIPLFF